MKATTSALLADEKTVLEALLRILREHGLEPQDSWLTVRAAYAVWSQHRTYTAIIKHGPASLALRETLRSGATNYAADVWVLDEAQARQLCDLTEVNRL